MKNLLKLEEAAEFAAAIAIFTQLPYAWWVFPALLLLPDLSMLGYLLNPRVGAATYNLVHHKGLGFALGLAGWAWGWPVLLLAGTVLWAHAAMDRIFGYGLKYNMGFHHTHLGSIGGRGNPGLSNPGHAVPNHQ